MKKITMICIGILTIVSLAGCAPLMLTLGAAGTAAVSVDTIRLERNVEYNRAWEAVIRVLEDQQAEIETNDKEKGLIKATVEYSEISINIAQMESRPTAMDITVRRKGLPNLKLADQLSEDINAQLRK